MNDGLKQRFVGAIVLICLALILWPVIFSGPSGPGMDRNSYIPPKPAIESFKIIEPVEPKNIDPVAQPVPDNTGPTVEALPEQVSKQSQDKADKPALNDKGLPKSWVLQVASFSKRGNATELKKALQAKGYKAFTREIKTNSGLSVRVYIGPKLSKASFAKDKQAIDRQFKVKSLIVKFVP